MNYSKYEWNYRNQLNWITIKCIVWLIFSAFIFRLNTFTFALDEMNRIELNCYHDVVFKTSKLQFVILFALQFFHKRKLKNFSLYTFIYLKTEQTDTQTN